MGGHREGTGRPHRAQGHCRGLGAQGGHTHPRGTAGDWGHWKGTQTPPGHRCRPGKKGLEPGQAVPAQREQDVPHPCGAHPCEHPRAGGPSRTHVSLQAPGRGVLAVVLDVQGHVLSGGGGEGALRAAVAAPRVLPDDAAVGGVPCKDGRAGKHRDRPGIARSRVVPRGLWALEPPRSKPHTLRGSLPKGKNSESGSREPGCAPSPAAKGTASSSLGALGALEPRQLLLLLLLLLLLPSGPGWGVLGGVQPATPLPRSPPGPHPLSAWLPKRRELALPLCSPRSTAVPLGPLPSPVLPPPPPKPPSDRKQPPPSRCQTNLESLLSQSMGGVG